MATNKTREQRMATAAKATNEYQRSKGKGSWQRDFDKKKFDDNWDRIFGKKEK